MAATKCGLVSKILLGKITVSKTSRQLRKAFFSTTNQTENESDQKVSGFAKFYESQESYLEKPKPESYTFASLLRHSKFIDLGDPSGKILVGEIFNIVDNDLYIDFGWKFYTVCSRPARNQNLYVTGTKVKVLIKDLELSERFLGAATDITLMEADCVLLGLLKQPQ